MRLAVTDACVFIDLCDAALVGLFFALEIEVHTSVDVFHELYPAQQQMLQPFVPSGRLTIHNISPADRLLILQNRYPKALSEMDKTVLYLAEVLDAMVLSSDGVVRNYVHQCGRECHGILWILVQLLAGAHLETREAATALRLLISANFMYRNNPKLNCEIEKRLKEWDVPF